MRMHMDDLSSDDEGPKNTIGTVPLEWYAEHDHIGYDVGGGQVMRPAGSGGVDRFLKAADDPHYKWTVVDERNGEEVVLSAREVELAKRIRSGLYPHPEFEPYPEYVDYFTSKVQIHPMNNAPEPKRRFLPSKWEAMKVMKIVRGMREGRYKPKDAKTKKEAVYLMWGEDDMAIGYETKKHAPVAIPAPKPPPPGHAASYNPPEEYLLTPEEQAQWEAMDAEDRPMNFLPQKYKTLRAVPAYNNFVRERFERCLDLYLAPRAIRKRLNVDPESLLPKLPDPSELRPFPTAEALLFEGHEGRVRSIAVDPTGQWLVSTGDDKTVRIWEVETGREMGRVALPDVGQCVAWNPNPGLHVVAVAVAKQVILLSTGTATGTAIRDTWEALRGSRSDAARAAEAAANGTTVDASVFGAAAGASEIGGDKGKAKGDGDGDGDGKSDSESDGDGDDSDGNVAGDALDDGDGDDDAVGSDEEPDVKTKVLSVWQEPTPDMLASGDALDAAGFAIAVVIKHTTHVKKLAWHRKGDYMAAVSPGAQYASVLIHQVTKRVSQSPFKKSVQMVQHAMFHPTKPLLFIATQRHVRVYHLINEELVRKLLSGAKWISSFDVHPTGDHVLVGSYDTRVVWFDMELYKHAYKTLRYHSKAVRQVQYHRSYPLMATASDDGTVHIFHAKVYSDIIQNPLLVPVKVLRGHSVTADGLGVLSLAFHPTQPWLFTAGADHGIKLWQNMP